MAKFGRHSLDFKKRAVARMAKCDNIRALAKELKVHHSTLYIWKAQLEGRAQVHRADLSQDQSSAREKQLLEENRLLKEALGDKALENDFFVDALRRIAERRQRNAAAGETVCTPRSRHGANRRKAN